MRRRKKERGAYRLHKALYQPFVAFLLHRAEERAKSCTGPEMKSYYHVILDLASHQLTNFESIKFCLFQSPPHTTTQLSHSPKTLLFTHMSQEDSNISSSEAGITVPAVEAKSDTTSVIAGVATPAEETTVVADDSVDTTPAASINVVVSKPKTTEELVAARALKRTARKTAIREKAEGHKRAVSTENEHKAA